MTQSTGTAVKETAATVGEKGREVAHDAAHEAQRVAETARTEMSELSGEMKTQAQRVMHDAKNKLRQQEEEQSQQLASTMREWSSRASALADGRPEEAGQLREYLQHAASRVQSAADRFEQRGIEGTLDEVQSFARRRPGGFLAAAAVAGFAVGRLVRGASAPSANGNAPRPQYDAYGNEGLPEYPPPSYPSEVQAAQPIGAGTFGERSGGDGY